MLALEGQTLSASVSEASSTPWFSCSASVLGSTVRAHLGEIERSDSAVIIQEDVYSVQGPSAFSQETGLQGHHHTPGLRGN